MCITKRPCANCPFRNDGEGVELRPGRIEGIVAESLTNDMPPFVCHKTLESNKQTCAGFLALMSKMDRLPVIGRLGLHTGLITNDDIEASRKLVIEKEDLNLELVESLVEKNQERLRKQRIKKLSKFVASWAFNLRYARNVL